MSSKSFLQTRRIARGVSLHLFLAVLTALVRGAAAQEVVFDHGACAQNPSGICTAAAKITAKHNAVITVVIRNTQPGLFDYSVAGIKPPETTKQLGETTREPFIVTIAHDKQYSGYVITAKLKQPNPPPGTSPNAVFTIEVQTSEFKTTFAGGFAITGLRDEALALQPIEKSDPAAFKLVDDAGNRDDARRAVATFVHIWHSLYPSIALTFGLGLDGGSGETSSASRSSIMRLTTSSGVA